jgi:protein TonB
MFRKRVFTMATVVLLHCLLLAGVWFARVELPHRDEVVMQIALLGQPVPAREQFPPVPPPVRIAVPVPVVLVDYIPAIQLPPTDEAAVPVAATRPSSAAPIQAMSQTLGTELAVQCPDRSAPRYPSEAKRQREQGEVRLRVELDESGRIANVTVLSSSGSPRLDDAARTAIESWHCRPAQNNGHPVRAVALQSLAFVLERH